MTDNVTYSVFTLGAKTSQILKKESAQQTLDIDPMLVQSWPTVHDVSCLYIRHAWHYYVSN